MLVVYTASRLADIYFLMVVYGIPVVSPELIEIF